MAYSHLFGTYECDAPESGRHVSRFAYQMPVTTPAFQAHLAARKPQETFDGPMYENLTHQLTIAWLNDAGVIAAVNDALTAIVPGETWTFTEGSASLSALVLHVARSETYYPQDDLHTYAAIDFSITTTPGWQRAETLATLSTAPTTLPGIITASGILGSMPAPFRALLTFDQATTMQALGIRHADATGAIQDYQGTADAAALSGQSAQGTMDADGTALGTPATLDSNVLRGWWLPIARVAQPDATPGDTTYFATSTVTGSGMAGTQAYVTASVPATVQTAFEKVILPPLPIPAGAIPDIDTGSGWSTPAVSISQVTEDADTSLAGLSGQTFPLTAGHKLTGFTAKSGTIIGTRIHEAKLYATAAGVATGAALAVSAGVLVAASNTEYEFVFDFVVPATATYAVRITSSVAGAGWPWRKNTAGGYADGDELSATNTIVTGDDLYFKVTTSTMRGFNSAVAVSAANAGAGTGKLDTVALVPYDEFSCITTRTSGADEGVLIDAMGDDFTVYGANKTGGIEALDQAKADAHGTPHIWPGTSAIMIDGDTANNVPQGCDLVLWYKPTYMTPYGG